MSTHEPGTVAVVNGRRALRVGNIGWHLRPTTESEEQLGEDFVSDSDVTDIRPLVVLDLDDPDAYGCSAVVHDPAKIVKALRDTNSVAAHAIAAQIEAQTKPARIPEPGLWGVVEANEPVGWQRTEWVHGPANAEGNDWHSVDGNWHRLWSDLVDPILVRDGIEDAS